MSEVFEVARWATVVTLLLLALRTAHLAHVRRFPGSTRLAAAFGLLAVGVLAARLTIGADGVAAEAVARVGRAAIVVYPVTLLWFLHAVVPVVASARAAVAGSAVVGVVAVLLGAGGQAAEVVARDAGTSMVFGVVAVGWAVAHGVVARRLWTSARTVGSPVFGRRLQAMAAGAAVLGAALFLLALASLWVRLVLNLAVIAAAVLFWTALDPPQPLRILARHRSTVTLRRVAAGLLRATRTDDLVAELLPLVAAFVGGDAAWLAQPDGVVGHHGLPAGEARRLTALLPARADRAQIRIPVEDVWVAAARAGSGWLAVRTGPFTPVFGSDELSLLEQIAHEVGVALERVRVQQQERDSLQRLEAAERLRDDLLSTVSHELRTPLTSVRGFAALLAASWERIPDGQRKELFERIVANTQEMEQLVEGLLRLSELRANGAVVAVDSGRLDHLIQSAIGGVGAELDRHTVAVDATPVPLRTDLHAVQRIVAQFLRNAAVHTPAGTTITVRGSGDTAAATVHVSDDGPGLTSEEAKRIFEPFYRAGHVLTRDSRGAGIGLALARERAVTVGGTVSVSSGPDAGTTFVLRFPRVHPGLDGSDVDPAGGAGHAAVASTGSG